MKRDLEEDLKKLADAFYENLEFNDSWEFGSVGVDGKRPFGNSFVEGDILDIIGWEPELEEEDYGCFSEEQMRYARKLYCGMLVPYLKKQWKNHKEN